MKNEHLVPVNVVDIVQRMADKNIKENEKINLLLRLEAIRDYAAAAIVKNSRSPVLVQNKK